VRICAVFWLKRSTEGWREGSGLTEAKAFSQANGWPQLLGRLPGAVQRRVRDRLTARRLRSPGFRVGRAPRILGLSHMQIGEDFHAGDALWLEAVLQYGGQLFEPHLSIGPHARLSDNVHIASLSRVSIGEHFLCGSRVLISDHTHGQYRGDFASDPCVPPAQRPLHCPATVMIGKNVWLGDGVAVLAGAEIGDGCVIGANAVVTGKVAPRTVAVGAPARVVRRWDDAASSWLPVQS
jgi:acetyltransferase-like isoleucine patch superfamily enzyme